MKTLFTATIAIGAYEMLCASGNRKPSFSFGAVLAAFGLVGVIAFGLVS